LRELAAKRNCFLAPCIYDGKDQESVVTEIASFYIQEFRKRVVEQQETGIDKVRESMSWQFVKYLATYAAPLLKHASFEEEREWRLISRPMRLDDSQMAYRSGRSMLTPYFRFKLCLENEPLEISRVTVGPTPHRRQAMDAVANMLSKHGVTGYVVGHTSTPYRNW
jgi:Protein of unknown function (DUF2971)